MGRTIHITNTNISFECFSNVDVNKEFIKMIEVLEYKYSVIFNNIIIDEDRLSFNDNTLDGEINDNVKALLYFSREIGIKLTGSFTLYDSQTGGAYYVIVYFANNYEAKVFTINADIGNCDYDQLPNITTEKINL